MTAPYTSPTSLAQGRLLTFAHVGTLPRHCDACHATLARDEYDELGREHIVACGQVDGRWLCPACYWPAAIA